MFKIGKISMILTGALLFLGVSAMAEGSAKCGAGKCGAANTLVQRDNERVEKKMMQADNMKCGAAKKNAIEKNKRLKKEIMKADNMKCGAAKEEAIKKVDIK